MQDKLLSIQEAGKLLGVSPKTLRRWEARGIFVPQRTAGNQRRYLKSQIENFKTNRELGVEVEFNPRSSQELIFPESPAQQSSPSIIDWEKRSKDAKNLARKAGLVLTIASFVTLSSLGGLLVLGRAGDYFGGIKNLAPKGQEETLSQGREILAAATEGLNPTFLVNIPSEFEEDAAFLGQIQAVGGIVTGGADIDAGDGSVFASNLLYGVASGSGVLISTGQTPTISNNGVLTLNNTIGDISLKGNGSVSVSTSESDKTVTISSSALTSEADTLATVTGRGATTSTATTFSGGLTVGGNLTLSDTSGVLNLAGGGTLAFKDGTNTLFTIVDSGSYGTVRLSDKGSTGDPSTCTAGDIYFNDTDNTVKACTSANTWEQLDSGGSGGITTFSLAGDSGTTQTITDSDTITIAGGTNGIDTVAGSTDTVTVNLDTTEISDATFGSGSGFTWTFNAGATDPTLAFASDQITLGATSIVMSTFTSNGGVLYTNGSGVLQQVTAGSSTQCLLGGAIPFFGSCEGTGTDAFWQQSSAGLLFPNNLTVDFGIGGTATPSAKFAVLNVNSGTPTATLSAGAAGGAYLSATGTLSTTAQQTLTLGTSATGNIVIDSGSSSITLSDATTASSSLTVSGTLTANGALDANGQIDLGDNGDSFSLDSTAFDVSTAGALSGITTLSLSGAISDTDSDVTINDGLVVTGSISDSDSDVTIADGLIVTGTISDSDSDVTIGDGLIVTGSISDSDSAVTVGDDLTVSGATITLSNAAFTGNNSSLYTTATTGVLAAAVTSTANLCLVSQSSNAPAWLACTSGGTDAFWNQGSGALFPNNSTVDLLVGAQATSSAEFAVTGINDGTPTATISATAGGSAGNGISLTGSTATIQSLIMGTLTLGGLTTGNIVIDSGSSSITLSDATTASSSLTVSGATTLNGAFTLGDNGDTGSVNTSDWDISTTGDLTGIGGITADGTVTLNGALDANGQIDLGDNGDSFSLDSTAFDVSTAGALSGITTLFLSGAISDTDSDVTISDGLVVTGSISDSDSDVTIADGLIVTGTISDSDSDVTIGDGLIVTGSISDSDSAVTVGDDLTVSGATITLSNAAFTGNNSSLYTTATTGVLAAAVTSTANLCLVSQSSNAPAWLACTSGGTDAFWNQGSGALFPNNSTVDLLVGAQATSSAEFAVTGINDGTPTATISATAGGSAGNGISLTGSTATIQSLIMGTLTLGGLTTGNIVIDSGSSSITLSDATTASSSLTVSGATTLNGAFTLGDNGDTGSVNTSDW